MRRADPGEPGSESASELRYWSFIGGNGSGPAKRHFDDRKTKELLAGPSPGAIGFY
jgi:hypothetical protein